MTVEQLLATYIAKFGENIQVKRFARFALGES
jgi:translation elongation factor EF-Ts